MPLADLIKTSLKGLRTNKSRSALTILGIVIGIASIILISSSGNVAENAIVGELGGLGAETVVVRPGKEPEGPTDFANVLFADSLRERELEALSKKSNVPDLARLMPEVFVAANASYKGETYEPTILGGTADFMMDVLGLELEAGEVFDERDVRARSQVAMIGSEVRKELFNGDDPLGESIQIKDRKFKVIGLFAPKGQVVFFNVDELILIPYTSAQTYLTGTKHYNQIITQANDVKNVDRAVFDIKATLRELHDIENPKDDDFSVQTQQGLVEQVSSIIGIFTIFLSLVVAISLVVGGVGIMNIMLVSVSERTREIGLRKAIGATEKDIRNQFLYEATILTSVGGLIGIAIGVALSFIVTIVAGQALGADLKFVFPWFPAFLGFFSSLLVGVVFGLYPAIKASKKSPIEALRYE
jgi:putative ABC transport system permease protein